MPETVTVNFFAVLGHVTQIVSGRINFASVFHYLGSCILYLLIVQIP